MNQLPTFAEIWKWIDAHWHYGAIGLIAVACLIYGYRRIQQEKFAAFEQTRKAKADLADLKSAYDGEVQATIAAKKAIDTHIDYSRQLADRIGKISHKLDITLLEIKRIDNELAAITKLTENLRSLSEKDRKTLQDHLRFAKPKLPKNLDFNKRD